MPKDMAESPLYYHERFVAYECLGCNEMLEVPRTAMLKIDGMIQRVQVRNNPENLMLWRELHELDHKDCGKFQDAEKAKDHREHRRTVAMPLRKAHA